MVVEEKQIVQSISKAWRERSNNIYQPRSYQKPLIQARRDGVKRAVAVWHRRAGKDLTCLNIIIEEMQKKIATYYHLFPEFSQGKRILWDGIDGKGKPFLSYFPKHEIDGKPNETEMQIKFKNGSIFQIIGTDKPDKIRGTNPYGCVFSEFSKQNPAVWNSIIKPIVMENGGWAIFNFTPFGNNHGKEIYTLSKNDPLWFNQLLTIRDTRRDAPNESGLSVISEEEIENERKAGMDEGIIQQEFFCSFEGYTEGSYYIKQLGEAEKEGRISNVPWNSDLPVDTWWDLGIGDATGIWFSQTVGKEIRLIDYYETSGEGLPYYTKYLKEKLYTYGYHHMPFDIKQKVLSTGKTRYEDALTLGIRPIRIVPKLPIDDGIHAVRSILSRCWFDAKKCKQGLDALRQYHKEYDEIRREFKAQPCHDWSSHGSDAFRYFAVGFREHIDYLPSMKANMDFDVFKL